VVSGALNVFFFQFQFVRDVPPDILKQLLGSRWFSGRDASDSGLVWAEKEIENYS
jgi:hypothetical protein